MLLIAIAASISVSCSFSQPGKQISETRLLLDTYCTITIHGDFESGLLDEAFELVEEYEKLFSITIEGSDVWRINHAGGEPVRVDPRVAVVIHLTRRVSELSDGMFDITIGRLSRLWELGDIPTQAQIEEALLTVDYRNTVVDFIDVENDYITVQLLNPDTWIDLGAVAKGYIAWRISEFLTGQGVTSALIDLGGDIFAIGDRADGSPWRIAIRKPFSENNEYIGYVELSNASISSSGIYERYFEVDGMLYHHILNPFTGKPAETNVVSATVVSDYPEFGEMLSTLFVLTGSDKALELINHYYKVFISGVILVLDNGEILEFGDVELKNEIK